MPKDTSEAGFQPETTPDSAIVGRWQRRHDAIFLLLTLVSLLLLLALFSYTPSDLAWSAAGEGATHNSAGRIGAVIADLLFHGLGYLAFALPLLVMTKLWLLFRKAPRPGGRVWMLRSVGIVLSVSMLCALAEMSIWHGEGLPAGSGGIIGKVIVSGFLPLFSFTGSAIIFTAGLALGLMLFLEFSWLHLFDRLGGWLLNLRQQAVQRRENRQAAADEADTQPMRDAVDEPQVAVKDAARKSSAKKASSSADESKAGPEVAGFDRFFSRVDNDLAADAGAEEPWLSDLDALTATADDYAEAPADSRPADNSRAASVRHNPAAEQQPPVLQEKLQKKTAQSPKAVSDIPPWEDEPLAQNEPAMSAPAEAIIPIEPLARKESRPSERAKRDLQGTLFNNDQPLPSIALLDPPRNDQKSGFSPERLQEMSKLLVQKLADFGVKIEVTAVAPGPVITRFEIQPAPGVKASKISNLARDLARSMAMISVRVVEVIPGKSVMGIEVPNEDRAVVSLSEVLSSEEYDRSKSPLTLALGHDIGGNPIITDLAKMPHLLVAGTTGSGKSVGVNAMLLSLLFKSTPDDLRLILVDPKMLELSVYEGIPHLLTPVITDMKEAANGLRWSVAEMERRYMLMAAMGVRNLAGYNKKVRDAIEAGQPLTDPLWQIDKSFETTPPVLEPLPYIVIVIDEFADMMMMVGKKVEELIARIAQKARAAGIHMILATQRPSVDVITGLIKANVPTRIAFQVSSKIDSRTILDQGGAEQLLGHGDMLYMPPGNALPERVHGAFVDDDEVHRLVAEWKLRGEPNYIEEITSSDDDGNGAFSLEGGDEKDDLYDQAVAFVTESGKCSISSVQRKLRIGYNRAARLVETMEAAGVVSSPAHNGSREVLASAPPNY